MIALHSVWREADTRFDRYVKVVGPEENGKLPIKTCLKDGSQESARTTKASVKAFGKRYKLVTNG